MGNIVNQWRTLTDPEWNYVLFNRNTNSGMRYAKAKVNNVNGVILFPDNWSNAIYSFNAINSIGSSFNTNIISVTQWTTFESAGAVFLPAGGGRNGTSVSDVGYHGVYWSASCYSKNYAYSYAMSFLDSYLGASGSSPRYLGTCVRLVAPIEN